MISKEYILNEDVQKELTEKIKELIRDSNPEINPSMSSFKDLKKNLYSTIREELSNDTRNTDEQLQYLNIFETAISVFKTAAPKIREAMDLDTLDHVLASQKNATKGLMEKDKEEDKEIPEFELKKDISDAEFFSNRYALHFAGELGLALLNEKKSKTKNRFSFGTDYDTSRKVDALTKKLSVQTMGDLSTIIEDLKKENKKITDDDLKKTLTSVFTAWSQQFNWDVLKHIAEKRGIQDLTLKYENFSINKGEFKTKHTNVRIDDRIMNVHKEDVIGAEGTYNDGDPKLGTVIWNNLKLLSAYDHELGYNPHKPASVIFTFGAPGSGKTFISHAYLRSFAEHCQKIGLPMWVLKHSTTDYASEFQNKTANELAKLADEIKRFPGIVIGYVSDADNIFLSRKKNLSPEQSNTLNIYLQMFDGQLIPKNGKVMWVMDANYIEGIDEATRSRLFDYVVEMKRFEAANDFAKFSKMSITKGVEKGIIKISDKQWMDVGNYLLKTPLSVREVGQVLNKIVSSTYVLPDSMIGAPTAEHAKYRADFLKNINPTMIKEQTNAYIQTRANISEASRRAKYEDGAERFLEHLNKEKNNAATK
ncbi:MAG: AAA family ATPase [Nanoarchaeota archaeon]|nr:ATP-binding protein [Nanoarchaeota archaeon]MBU1030842.1 ATP-binding protein [Nanoarchaeota archaeon]MBU1850249.1 ATP-binding protein [Nanoarchaeota archaeon]